MQRFEQRSIAKRAFLDRWFQVTLVEQNDSDGFVESPQVYATLLSHKPPPPPFFHPTIMVSAAPVVDSGDPPKITPAGEYDIDVSFLVIVMQTTLAY
jgi:hypothetical protein